MNLIQLNITNFNKTTHFCLILHLIYQLLIHFKQLSDNFWLNRVILETIGLQDGNVVNMVSFSKFQWHSQFVIQVYQVTIRI